MRDDSDLAAPASSEQVPPAILESLQLDPRDVAGLAPKARNALISFLIRWKYYDEARPCLEELISIHSKLVSTYDKLALIYIETGQPRKAIEIMRRRKAIKSSTLSQAREARAHLAAGDVASASKIAGELMAEHPSMLNTWRLQADICLASGDLDGADAVLEQMAALRPEAALTAQYLARLWQARGDSIKALLLARTSLARSRRDERQAPVDLLHLLEFLYRTTEQPAQAEAIAIRLYHRQREELKELQDALEPASPPATPSPAAVAPKLVPVPVPLAEKRVEFAQDVIAGKVDLTSQEERRLNHTLQKTFAHDTFRPGQADVVAAILRGESVLAVMPTGAGKSLCYQLSALLLPGTTLVISPLIALMKDQLDGLPSEISSQATTINSTLGGAELEARLARASAGTYKLLYAAPERFRQRPFLGTLKRAGISLMVVDESHCVSLWGHDFRPDYHFISRVWKELGQPPILAMTATATPRVRDDVQAALGQMRLVLTDIQRPNLFLQALGFVREAEKRQALLSLCREIEGSGIVYARSRAKCEQLAEMLRNDGVSATHYHAGIRDRAAAQDRFMSDQVRVVVATIAFGMGVDKADVRFIIHYDLPKSLENYFQEAGRAGRDGLPARCILFHSRADMGIVRRLTRQDTLQAEFLRRTYANLERRLGTEGTGLVSMPDLERDLQTDSTRLRVAVHFLERAGLLWRGYDLPRTARLRLSPSATQRDADFARFVEAAHLCPSQSISCNMEELCRDSGSDPRTIETQLLAWHSAGWLRYRGIGRDMLLALPVPPADSRQRVAAMLAEYHSGQSARLAEIMAYATTAKCRHGHISAYFGGRRIERCQTCDNCLSAEVTVPKTGRPTRRSGRKSQAYPAKISTRAAQQSQGGTGGYDKVLFDRLRAWRLATAKDLEKPAFVIFHNSVLQRIAAIHPTTLDELAAIKGIGPYKIEHYGKAVLAVVAEQSITPPNTDLG